MSVSEAPRFWYLAPGLIVPEAAVVVALDIERAGHRLILDGDDVPIEQGRGCGAIDPALVEAARCWRAHLWLIARHVTSDGAGPRAADSEVRHA